MRAFTHRSPLKLDAFGHYATQKVCVHEHAPSKRQPLAFRANTWPYIKPLSSPHDCRAKFECRHMRQLDHPPPIRHITKHIICILTEIDRPTDRQSSHRMKSSIFVTAIRARLRSHAWATDSLNLMRSVAPAKCAHARCNDRVEFSAAKANGSSVWSSASLERATNRNTAPNCV